MIREWLRLISLNSKKTVPQSSRKDLIKNFNKEDAFMDPPPIPDFCGIFLLIFIKYFCPESFSSRIFKRFEKATIKLFKKAKIKFCTIL